MKTTGHGSDPQDNVSRTDLFGDQRFDSPPTLHWHTAGPTQQNFSEFSLPFRWDRLVQLEQRGESLIPGGRHGECHLALVETTEEKRFALLDFRSEFELQTLRRFL
jgi:hypothetical protein